MTAIVRYLGSSLPAVETAFIRYALGSVLMIPILLRMFRSPPTARVMGVFATRGVIHAIGVGLWFFAMARIPMAEVTAIAYIAPIFITIGAALFLGERLHGRRIAGVIFGLIGALIILRPGFQELNIGQLAQLISTPFFAASFLITKKLSGTEDSSVIVTMLSVCCTLALLPGALYFWVPPTWAELGWLGLTAVVATAAHYSMTRSYEAAPISVTQPISFLQLVWAAIMGMVLFGEALDLYIFAGAAVIVGAATYISHREAKASRAERNAKILAERSI